MAAVCGYSPPTSCDLTLSRLYHVRAKMAAIKIADISYGFAGGKAAKAYLKSLWEG